MLRIKIYISLGILSLMISACKDGTTNKVVEDVVFNLESYENEEIHSTEYTDLQFIPLDNARDCLLSNASRLKITDLGYYIFNDTGFPSVLLFNKDGSFNRKIGDVGKSKSEYQNIMDIAANGRGDTVAIMTLTDLKQYDANGKFIASYSFDEKQRWENLLYTPDGFVCSRNYRGTDCLVAMYDKGFTSIQKIVLTDEAVVTGEPPYADNILQNDDKYLCYMDMFNSRFYVSEWKDLSHPHCYMLKSERMMTLNNVQEKGRDYIYSYILADHVIKGRMLYKNDSRGFEINLEKKTFRFCDEEGLFVSFKDYYNSYYYSIVTPAELLRKMDEGKTFLNHFTPSIDSLRKAFKPYKDSLSEENNYYILRMKIKEKSI